MPDTETPAGAAFRRLKPTIVGLALAFLFMLGPALAGGGLRAVPWLLGHGLLGPFDMHFFGGHVPWSPSFIGSTAVHFSLVFCHVAYPARWTAAVSGLSSFFWFMFGVGHYV